MNTYDPLRYGHATLDDLHRLHDYGMTVTVWVTGSRDDDEHGWLDGYWGPINASMFDDLHPSRNDVSPVLTVTASDVDPDDEDRDTLVRAIVTEWHDLTARLDTFESNGDGTYYGQGDHSRLTDDGTLMIALHVEVTGVFNPAAPTGRMLDPVRVTDLPT